eukprot:Amastigsp_a339282_32.p6 type:complete len:151 gc:universal Amastigsp_a339282_32:862-410(-)
MCSSAPSSRLTRDANRFLPKCSLRTPPSRTWPQRPSSASRSCARAGASATCLAEQPRELVGDPERRCSGSWSPMPLPPLPPSSPPPPPPPPLARPQGKRRLVVVVVVCFSVVVCVAPPPPPPPSKASRKRLVLVIVVALGPRRRLEVLAP